MALGLVYGSGFPSDAMGTDGEAPTGTSSLEEIVVTATRRAERLQDVAVSATAFTQEKLDIQGLRSIDDVTRLTPGVTFQRDATTSAGNFNDEDSDINIRGVDSTAGTSTVGIYIDDTPIQGRHISFTSFNAFPALFDLERVEVLRGPQGTLFGAGSEGGTVRFIQPSPDLHAESVYLRSEAATTHDGAATYEIGGAVGGPIVEDTLGFRVSASFREDGGWVDHVNYVTRAVTDSDSNFQDTVVVRGALKWAITERLSITPSVYYQQLRLGDTSAYWPSLSDPGAGNFENGNAQRNPSTDPFYLAALKIEWDAAFAHVTFIFLAKPAFDFGLHAVRPSAVRADLATAPGRSRHVARCGQSEQFLPGNQGPIARSSGRVRLDHGRFLLASR
jgi:outer membrane receptor protein involved in Fe transport